MCLNFIGAFDSHQSIPSLYGRILKDTLAITQVWALKFHDCSGTWEGSTNICRTIRMFESLRRPTGMKHASAVGSIHSKKQVPAAFYVAGTCFYSICSGADIPPLGNAYNGKREAPPACWAT